MWVWGVGVGVGVGEGACGHVCVCGRRMRTWPEACGVKMCRAHTWLQLRIWPYASTPQAPGHMSNTLLHHSHTHTHSHHRATARRAITHLIAPPHTAPSHTHAPWCTSSLCVTVTPPKKIRCRWWRCARGSAITHRAIAHRAITHHCTLVHICCRWWRRARGGKKNGKKIPPQVVEVCQGKSGKDTDVDSWTFWQSTQHLTALLMQLKDPTREWLG